jgi:HK97 gp10 family phage protein
VARAFSPTATSIRLEGAQSLNALLDGLPKKIANKILREALKKGGKIIQADAKARAPVDTGLLRRSITVRKGKRKRKGSQSVVIFPDVKKFEGKVNLGAGSNNRVTQSRGDFYAPYVEFGTSTRTAQPFMRPAFESKKAQALAIVRKEVTAAVTREKAKGKQ